MSSLGISLPQKEDESSWPGSHQRKRKEVAYTELTEKEWLKAIDEFEEDEKKRKKGRNRRRQEDEEIPSSSKKKSRTDINLLKKRLKNIMKKVIDYTDEAGRVLSLPFMNLPSRRELPDYYDVIMKPMAIKKIMNRIEDCKYNDISDLERDFFTLCANAQTYNEDTSLIYADSVRLRNVFIEERRRYENGQNSDNSDENENEEDESSWPGSHQRKRKEVAYTELTEKEWLKAIDEFEEDEKKRKKGRNRRRQEDSEDEEIPSSSKKKSRTELNLLKKRLKNIMKKVIDYTDEAGRILSESFMNLPSRRELPNYYNVIMKPMAIKTIMNRIEDYKYNDILDLERDFFTLCANAQFYNYTATQIYADSVRLRNVFIEERQRYENGQNSDDSDENENEEEDSDGESNRSVKMKIKLKGKSKGTPGRKRKQLKYSDDEDYVI